MDGVFGSYGAPDDYSGLPQTDCPADIEPLARGCCAQGQYVLQPRAVCLRSEGTVRKVARGRRVAPEAMDGSRVTHFNRPQREPPGLQRDNLFQVHGLPDP